MITSFMLHYEFEGGQQQGRLRSTHLPRQLSTRRPGEASPVSQNLDAERQVTHETLWTGRFPRNEIISLLDVNRHFNLAESTSNDLTLGEIVDLAGGMAVLGN